MESNDSNNKSERVNKILNTGSYRITRRDFMKLMGATAGTLALGSFTGGLVKPASASVNTPQTPLPGSAIPKYVDPLPHFAGTRVRGANLFVTMEEFQQQVLPAAFPPTWVWGYGINNGITTYGPLYPGFTVEATQGVPTKMTYINNLPNPPLLQQYITYDQTLHWADPLGIGHVPPNTMCPVGAIDPTAPAWCQPYIGPPPLVTHLHGGEVPQDFDGGPDQWFTPNGLRGVGYRTKDPTAINAAVYEYPNAQEATTLWFHDHTLGATRLNVYAGLAAFYFLRDNRDTGFPNNPIGLPADDYEIEIVIQDRMFDTNGQWYFPDVGDNPEHPFWIPEFLGDAIVVNGKTWPFLEVEPRRYRFRFLNGSNARVYRMWLEDMIMATPGPVFWQIGTDGGLLDLPVKVDPADPVMPQFLIMAPGERADIIIDFSGFDGQILTLRNNARAPFPKGVTVDPKTNGQIMQFRVVKPLQNPDTSYDPSTLNPLRPPMNRLNPANATVRRQLTLNEVMGAVGPLEALVNNTKWAGKRLELVNGIPQPVPIPGLTPDNQGNYLSELPAVGSTEVWEVINLTGDAHPIHLHLVQFQIINRQNYNVNKYTKVYDAAFPGGGYDPVTMQAYPAGVYIPAFGPPLAYDPGAPGAILGGNPDITPYLQGPVRPPEPNEVGWKDTVIMYPGEVTRIVVRFTAQNGSPFPFDSTGNTKYALDANGNLATGPGYVWHCHIVDHEDNEMMRPYHPV